MMSLSPTKVLTTLAMMLTLSACGPQIPVLPDDPHNEPAATFPGDGNNEGQGELPSETPPDVAEPTTPTSPPNPEEPVLTEREQILKMYDYLDPNQIVPTKPLEEAVIYFHKNKSKFKNTSVISVLDFSQKSTQKRWYFINMQTGSVWNVHVSHGKGSDSNHDGYAEKFSNTSGSNASSLGFYKTAETYTGSNGYSLRLDGLSTTNSNARSRAIVVHGANYVQDSSVIQGRSWGCPAVSQSNRDKVINMIKGGSLIYAVNKY
ncbi:murein L,D-transpeptidase catalytic domain family protein [Bdellovibrio sp. 22V]|uniref:murein L,D-transpeptidase catalytic domain family protein n=1 Tax=Bdellovibrio TaxID=958 RepID=UPI002543B0F7|nr:murein L,D-transpeptidase catalytic domain family protein [Bdellovibrio sp. 22V]WII73487.1 murein L,D-transpeptidase catalytic domain family protein [Bdellovibrio sp. 22V]